MIIGRGCFERGCVCYDDRVDKGGVEVVKREWVGLTDDESIELLQKAAKHKSPNYCTAPEMAVEFGRLVSEALKEKNCGQD